MVRPSRGCRRASERDCHTFTWPAGPGGTGDETGVPVRARNWDARRGRLGRMPLAHIAAKYVGIEREWNWATVTVVIVAAILTALLFVWRQSRRGR